MGGIGRYLVTEYQMSHDVFVSRDTELPLGKVTWLRQMLCTYKVMLSKNSGKSRVIHKVHVADEEGETLRIFHVWESTPPCGVPCWSVTVPLSSTRVIE